MKKSLFSLFLFLLLFYSCNLLTTHDGIIDLKKVVPEVIAGKDSTHKSLLLLRDEQLPPACNYNKIEIDTIKINSKKYYSLIAEYPNPVYNRFAIIDSQYNILLMDKSLNGFLKENILQAGSKKFIEVNESFISQGDIQLRRVSLYSIETDNDAELAFRTYTELKSPQVMYTQKLTDISPIEIKTEMTTSDPEDKSLPHSTDVFLFNINSKQYMSDEDIFDTIILGEVENSSSETGHTQIVSWDSLLHQMGVKIIPKQVEHKLGSFSMPLTDDWNEVDNIKISLMLKKPVEGVKYINNHYGAEISVIRLTENDSAENYISYKLTNISAGNYKVRFSEKITLGKYYYQFFEYSCGREKFMLILQTLKSTYETYKSDYQNLINSFSMDC